MIYIYFNVLTPVVDIFIYLVEHGLSLEIGHNRRASGSRWCHLLPDAPVIS